MASLEGTRSLHTYDPTSLAFFILEKMAAPTVSPKKVVKAKKTRRLQPLLLPPKPIIHPWRRWWLLLLKHWTRRRALLLWPSKSILPATTLWTSRSRPKEDRNWKASHCCQSRLEHKLLLLTSWVKRQRVSKKNSGWWGDQKRRAKYALYWLSSFVLSHLLLFFFETRWRLTHEVKSKSLCSSLHGLSHNRFRLGKVAAEKKKVKKPAVICQMSNRLLKEILKMHLKSIRW